MKKTWKRRLSAVLTAALVITGTAFNFGDSTKVASAEDEVTAAVESGIAAQIHYADYAESVVGDGPATVVNGDGTYTVKFENPNANGAEVEDAGVLVVDLKNLKNEVKDTNDIQITDIQLTKDGEAVTLDERKIITGFLDKDSNDYRIELFNRDGETRDGAPFNNKTFRWEKEVTVTFTIAGLGAAAEPSAEPSADPGTEPSAEPTEETPAIAAQIYYANYAWSAQGDGAVTTVDKDGTYTVTFANPNADGAAVEDAGVFVVDLKHLNSVVNDLDAVKITDIKVQKDGEDFDADASKFITGNIEDQNDNYRIEIFNQYGNSKENPAFDSENFKWEKEVSVTFTISGLNGNFNNKWANASIYYANYAWSAQGNGTPLAVTGDGDYTVTFKNPNEDGAAVEDAGVFVVDLKDINAKVTDYNNIKITDIKVTKDGEEVTADASKYLTGNIEDQNDNYRIEIFNQYGNSKEDPAFDSESFKWEKELAVSFHIEGIEWGAADTETPAIAAQIYYANYAWSAQGDGAVTTVNGNGTYTVTFANPNADGAAVEDAGVFVVDLKHLNSVVKDLDAIKITDIKVKKDGEDVEADASKFLTGNIEDQNDNYRIEIFNQYGDSKENPAFDSESFKWEKEISVTFTISGLNGNYNKRWANAGIYYANYAWSAQGDGTPLAVVGDGDYTVTFANPNADGVAVEDAGVFVVDLKNLNAKVTDYNNIKITNIKVTKDGEEVTADETKFITGNIEDQNDNYRIEIFNQYGDSKNDPAFDSESFKWEKEVSVSFHIEGIEWGEPAATDEPSDEPSEVPAGASSYNVYLGYQTNNYAFRDSWDNDTYGLESTKLDYKSEVGSWDGSDLVKTKADIKDAKIDHNGTYTVSISGVDLQALGAETYNMVFLSTDIPVGMKNIKITDVTLSVDGGEPVAYAKELPIKPDSSKTYYFYLLINDANYGEAEAEHKTEDVGMATNSISATFTVSGGDFEAAYSAPKTSTLGLKKGKTFTSGNFKYKVTTTAKKTVTTTAGETKTTTKAGKVAIAGLSAKGKKAKSLTLPATIKNGSASYTVSSLAAGAFSGAKAAKITLNKNIKKLPKNAFKNCTKLSTLALKAKLSSANKTAFDGCKKTIKISGTSASANVKLLNKKTSYAKFK